MGVLYGLIYVGGISILIIEHTSKKHHPSPPVAILQCTILLPLDLSYQAMKVIEVSKLRFGTELANVGLMWGCTCVWPTLFQVILVISLTRK